MSWELFSGKHMYVLYEFLWQNVFPVPNSVPKFWFCPKLHSQHNFLGTNAPNGLLSIVFCLLLIIACCLIQWTLPIACCLSHVAIWCVCPKKSTLGMVFGTEQIQWADTIGDTIGNTIWQIPGPPLGIYIYIYVFVLFLCPSPRPLMVARGGPGPRRGLSGNSKSIANHILGTHNRFSLSYI